MRRAARLAPDDFEYSVDLIHLTRPLAAESGHDAVAEEYLALAFEADPAALGHAEALAEWYASHGQRGAASRVLAVAAEYRPGDPRLGELRACLEDDGKEPGEL